MANKIQNIGINQDTNFNTDIVNTVSTSGPWSLRNKIISSPVSIDTDNEL